ncbi:hypothetical protein D3C78_771950 [compost metagenome]
MASSNHRLGGKFAAVGQFDALDLPLDRDDLFNCCVSHHLPAQLFEPRAHCIAQLLHASQDTSYTKSVEKPEERIINATAISGNIAGEAG